MPLNELDWIVVPGGPGMSNSYLKYALASSFAEFKLCFYVPYGAPESEKQEPTIEELVEQIQEVAEINGLREYGLITHSFGNYLALRALQKSDENNIQALIMLNPIPFKYESWRNALNAIVQKIPEDLIEELNTLSRNQRGEEFFRLIYSFYIGNRNPTLPLDVSFNIEACNSISAKVYEYDDNDFISTISIPLVKIIGQKDPFNDNSDVISDKTIILNEVGHYPFFEDPEQFSEAINSLEDLLCQKKMSRMYF